MGRYILRRLLQALPLLFAISIASFAILKATPGGPLAAYEGNPSFTEADRLRLEHAFGLDRPLPVQYLSWLGSFLTGDWGYGFASHQPVLMLIGERLPNTLLLMGTVFVVVLLFAIPIGVTTALKQYSVYDHAVTGATFTFLSTPTFWLGLLLIILFGLQLRWLPLGGVSTPGAPLGILLKSFRPCCLENFRPYGCSLKQNGQWSVEITWRSSVLRPRHSASWWAGVRRGGVMTYLAPSKPGRS